MFVEETSREAVSLSGEKGMQRGEQPGVERRPAMRTDRRVNIWAVMAVVVVGTMLMVRVYAGDLDAPAGPNDAASAMYTIEDVYNRLTENTQATKRGSTFQEPGSGPTAGTGKTLDEVYEKAIPTQVPRTGQTPTVPFAAPAGSDGALQKGVAWPAPRFSDNGDGTVTDNLTGLLWLKDANCTDTVGGVDKSGQSLSWADALTWSNNLAIGSCGLSDGSIVGDWRLPNVKELFSLIDWAYYDPALSDAAGTGQWTEGDAFSAVVPDDYWSSTTSAGDMSSAWNVSLYRGYCGLNIKASDLYVWPVRGRQ